MKSTNLIIFRALSCWSLLKLFHALLIRAELFHWAFVDTKFHKRLHVNKIFSLAEFKHCRVLLREQLRSGPGELWLFPSFFCLLSIYGVKELNESTRAAMNEVTGLNLIKDHVQNVAHFSSPSLHETRHYFLTNPKAVISCFALRCTSFPKIFLVCTPQTITVTLLNSNKVKALKFRILPWIQTTILHYLLMRRLLWEVQNMIMHYNPAHIKFSCTAIALHLLCRTTGLSLSDCVDSAFKLMTTCHKSEMSS